MDAFPADFYRILKKSLTILLPVYLLQSRPIVEDRYLTKAPR